MSILTGDSNGEFLTLYQKKILNVLSKAMIIKKNVVVTKVKSVLFSDSSTCLERLFSTKFFTLVAVFNK
jgi:hypothetical protein